MGRSFVVIGGGQQGLVAARALADGPGRPSITVVDTRPAPPGASLTWLRAEATSREALRLGAAADACVVALPGDVADGAVRKLAGAGARVADMSFVPEPWLAGMGQAAVHAGAVVVRDVGVAPGLSHILAAALHRQLGGLDRLTIYVGGLPQEPPASRFRHAVYFNASDLLSEYTRPARLRRRGRDLEVDALSPRQTRRVVDGALGQLEAFPSDGLRTLLASFPDCPAMEELTLRWPGHLQEMRRMRREGLLERGEGGIGPAMLTAVALDEAFPARDFPDVLLMEVHGTRGPKSAAWRLVDHRKGGQTAMSRTTGFTAAAAARALATGAFATAGVHGPEALGFDPKARASILKAIRGLGVRLGRKARLRAGA